MALLSFKVEQQKSVRLAEAASVPAVMVITGPNGVGKSTLLYGIKSGAGQTSGPTRMLYQGPHRVLRRTQVQRRWLGGGPKWLQDLLGSGEVSGYEGLSFPNASRTPDNVDEAGSTIKHTLGKIENRRQAILAAVVDRKKAAAEPFDLGSLPDIYEPVRTLTQYLLPHLKFSRVDFTNEDNVRCLWTRADAANTLELDIDDLSSGEKSIVILFLPLLEDQVRDKLQLLEDMAKPGQVAAERNEDRVVLIDEPEQHLHPDLQAKILSYMRGLSKTSRVQFVITTHSPTIMDQAFDDELFVLSPPVEGVVENQLRRIATNAERLEALKQLAGSAYFLTTGRIIVCIEGESGSETIGPTDLSLLEIMYPRATAFTLVPTRGKGNVINTVTRLRDHVPEGTFRIRVRGLVDADQSDKQVDGVETLPVCMIENLLLDANALYGYCASIGVDTVADAAAVAAELQRIFVEMRDDEIALRVALQLKPQMVRVAGATVAEVQQVHQNQVAALQNSLPNEAALRAIVDDVTKRVDGILADGSAADIFRGKVALKEFYQRHISPKNIGYKQACLEVAKRIAERGKVAARLDPIFERLAS